MVLPSDNEKWLKC